MRSKYASQGTPPAVEKPKFRNVSEKCFPSHIAIKNCTYMYSYVEFHSVSNVSMTNVVEILVEIQC